MNPLAGRSVVVTHAADHVAASKELVSSFEATPVIVPLIEIVDEPTGMAELSSLDFSGVDWVVATSPNGASRFASLMPRGSSVPRVAAVGASTAAALPRCDLVAETPSALGLLEIFPPGPGRVVVVQAVDAAPTLVEGLVANSWNVVAISPYRAVPTVPSREQQLAALAADAVLFASGSAARAWVEVFGRRTPPVVVAIGQQTAADCERAGLKVSAVSADHTMYGMLVALRMYLSKSN